MVATEAPVQNGKVGAVAGTGGGLAKREREAAPAPAGDVKTITNAAVSRPGSVERVDDRTEVIDNGDGTKTARIRVVPQSFQGSKGREAVDTELVESGGRLIAKSTAEPISVALSSGAVDLVVVGEPGKQIRVGRPNGSGLTSAKVRGDSAQPPGQGAVLGEKKDASPSTTPESKAGSATANGPASPTIGGREALEGERSNRGVKAGEGTAVLIADVPAKRKGGKNEVSFPESFGAGTELVYEILPDAVKESIILASPPAGLDAPVYRFPISTDGLSFRQNKDGAFEFFDKVGTVAFTIPGAFAFDSRAGANTPGNAYTNVKTELRSDGEGLTLVLSPSPEWLRDPKRVYPVVIDPTIQTQPWNPMNLAYMPWGDNSGGNTFSAWTNEMVFGNWWGSQWRSYIQFDPTIFAGKTINNATLNIRVNNCDNQSNPAAPYGNPIRVHQLTSGYYFGQAWSGPSFQGDIAVLPGGNGTTSSVNITSWASQWAGNPASNFGLMFDMGTAQGYCRAYRTAPNGQQTFIEVTYNEVPAGATEFGIAKNFSFETGISAWSPCYRAEFATLGLQSSGGQNGAKFARLRSENTAGPVSLCQTVPFNTGPGQRYDMKVYVKSATGAPVQGRVILWESGNTPANAFADFTAGASWTAVDVSLPGQYASNIALRAEIMVGAPFTSDLDIDSVALNVVNTTPVTPPPPPPPPAPATTVPPVVVYGPSVLQAGQTLGVNGYLLSKNGQYQLVQQNDGHLVLYTPTGYSWSNVYGYGNPGATTTLSWDGNLVSSINGVVLWQSNTPGHGGEGAYLNLQNDGNLVVYRGNDTPYWSTLTGPIAPPPPPPPPPPVNPPALTNAWDSPAPIFVGNGMTGHCIFVRDYAMAAGMSVVAANCTGNEAERWVPEKIGSLYRLHPFYNNSLCLDIDNYDGSTNTLTPVDGARAQVYTCSGSNNQSFNMVEKNVGYWQIQPQTGGVRCLDEDVTRTNDTSYISYFVQHFTCGTQTNQYWRPYGQSGGAVPPTPPPTTVPAPTPTGTLGAAFGSQLTAIEVPGTNLCIGPSFTLVVIGSESCVNVMPFITANGLKLLLASNWALCLSASNSGSLQWESCESAKSWKDYGPAAGMSYPDSSLRFPIWFDSSNCITRSGNSAGSIVSLGICGSVASDRLWTDGYDSIVTATSIEIVNNSDTSIPKARAYLYSPAVVGNRIFFCANFGSFPFNTPTDYLVSGVIGQKISLTPTKVYRVPGEGQLSCDPFAIQLPDSSYRVFFTHGRSKENCRIGCDNGVDYVNVNSNGSFPERYNPVSPYVPLAPQNHEVVPACTNGPGDLRYGCGSPSLAKMSNGKYLLAYKTQGLVGPNGAQDFVGFWQMNADATALDSIFYYVPNTAGSEDDGPGPEMFYRSDQTATDRKLYRLVQGCNQSTASGGIGFRTYFFSGANGINREVLLETGVNPNSQNRTAVPSPNCFDSIGVVRNSAGDAVANGNTVSYWRSVVIDNSLKGKKLELASITLP